jgi:hypothetical protein
MDKRYIQEKCEASRSMVDSRHSRALAEHMSYDSNIYRANIGTSKTFELVAPAPVFLLCSRDIL